MDNTVVYISYERSCSEVKKILEGSKINWVTIPFRSSVPLLSPLFNLLSLNSVANGIVRRIEPKIVHCRSYMAAMVGLSLKRKYGYKFLFDMRGFWADERMEGRIWNNSNPVHAILYKFFKRKEIEFLNEADYSICLTENAKQEILSWKGIDPLKTRIEVIPCCADLDLFSVNSIKPEKLKVIKNELGITENDLVITYVGSIGTWYLLDEMLDFFKQLLTKRSNAKFLFITPDSRSEILKKAGAKSIDAKRIIVTRSERRGVPYYIATGNISIFFIKPSYSKKASSPTKMAEIMGMGIPVICNDGVGDLDKHVVSGQNGFIIKHFSKEDYQSVVDNIDNMALLDKRKIWETAEKYYSINTGIDRYDAVYRALLT